MSDYNFAILDEQTKTHGSALDLKGFGDPGLTKCYLQAARLRAFWLEARVLQCRRREFDGETGFKVDRFRGMTTPMQSLIRRFSRKRGLSAVTKHHRGPRDPDPSRIPEAPCARTDPVLIRCRSPEPLVSRRSEVETADAQP